MKTAKKLTALLLAVVMVLAMSVSAFATDNSTATLNVTIIGSAEPSRTVTLSSTTTIKDAIDQYADELAPVWKEVVNYNPNFGDTAYVAETIYGVGTDPVGADSGITAQFWSSQYPGYGIESTEIVDGKTLYHYIYVGYDWVYTVNGETPVDATNGYQLYMDQYTLTSGDTIELTYDLQITQWTSYDYWLTA